MRDLEPEMPQLEVNFGFRGGQCKRVKLGLDNGLDRFYIS